MRSMPTTNKPITFDGQEHREMTDAEYAQWRSDVEAQVAQAVANAAKQAARESALAKLAGLGLTETELSALVG